MADLLLDNITKIYRPRGKQMVKGHVDLDFPIYPGDTIVVEDRWF